MRGHTIDSMKKDAVNTEDDVDNRVRNRFKPLDATVRFVNCLYSGHISLAVFDKHSLYSAEELDLVCTLGAADKQTVRSLFISPVFSGKCASLDIPITYCNSGHKFRQCGSRDVLSKRHGC